MEATSTATYTHAKICCRQFFYKQGFSLPNENALIMTKRNYGSILFSPLTWLCVDKQSEKRSTQERSSLVDHGFLRLDQPYRKQDFQQHKKECWWVYRKVQVIRYIHKFHDFLRHVRPHLFNKKVVISGESVLSESVQTGKLILVGIATKTGFTRVIWLPWQFLVVWWKKLSWRKLGTFFSNIVLYTHIFLLDKGNKFLKGVFSWSLQTPWRKVGTWTGDLRSYANKGKQWQGMQWWKPSSDYILFHSQLQIKQENW